MKKLIILLMTLVFYVPANSQSVGRLYYAYLNSNLRTYGSAQSINMRFGISGSYARISTSSLPLRIHTEGVGLSSYAIEIQDDEVIVPSGKTLTVVGTFATTGTVTQSGIVTFNELVRIAESDATEGLSSYDADSDTFAAGTAVVVYKDGADVYFEIDSLGTVKIDGNKGAVNMFQAINDNDGSVGDSSFVVNKLGAISTSTSITTTGSITDGTYTSDGSGNFSGVGTLAASGAITASGGITQPTMTPVVWATGGSTVLATSGTDTAPTNGPRWWTEVQVPYNVTLTGIFYLIGSVGGTDSVVVDLYNSAGTLVASSYSGAAGAADLVAAAANIQKVAFTSTYAAVAGKYYASLQFNGTTARFRTYPVPGSPFIAATAGGTYRTAASITPGSTFTAGKGPISGVY